MEFLLPCAYVALLVVVFQQLMIVLLLSCGQQVKLAIAVTCFRSMPLYCFVVRHCAVDCWVCRRVALACRSMRVVSTYVSLIVAFPDFSLLHFVATSYGEAMTACRGFRRCVVAFSAAVDVAESWRCCVRCCFHRWSLDYRWIVDCCLLESFCRTGGSYLVTAWNCPCRSFMEHVCFLQGRRWNSFRWELLCRGGACPIRRFVFSLKGSCCRNARTLFVLVIVVVARVDCRRWILKSLNAFALNLDPFAPTR